MVLILTQSDDFIIYREYINNIGNCGKILKTNDTLLSIDLKRLLNLKIIQRKYDTI